MTNSQSRDDFVTILACPLFRGIGPKLANAIVSNTTLGIMTIKSLGDLKQIPGIGDTRTSIIRDGMVRLKNAMSILDNVDDRNKVSADIDNSL